MIDTHKRKKWNFFFHFGPGVEFFNPLLEIYVHIFEPDLSGMYILSKRWNFPEHQKYLKNSSISWKVTLTLSFMFALKSVPIEYDQVLNISIPQLLYSINHSTDNLLFAGLAAKDVRNLFLFLPYFFRMETLS